VAEDLAGLGLGRFRLVTLGQSFHWTRGVPVLDAVYDLLEPGGAVALIGHCQSWRPVPAGPGLPRIPEDEVMALVARHASGTGVPRGTGTPHAYEDALRASRFADCRLSFAPGRLDVVRDVDSVVSGYYSTSFAAPRHFGDRRHAFEAEARRLLDDRSSDGLFWDWPGDTEIALARKDGGAGVRS